jgi:hypothetical protein
MGRRPRTSQSLVDLVMIPTPQTTLRKRPADRRIGAPSPDIGVMCATKFLAQHCRGCEGGSGRCQELNPWERKVER